MVGQPEAGRLPSLDLLRRMTDRHVLEALFDTELLTRPEIAARTGLSRPTISDSVRRLTQDGLVTTAGQQAGGRGRSGLQYRLNASAGAALTVAVGARDVTVQVLDLSGQVGYERTEPVRRPISSRRLGTVITQTVVQAVRSAVRSIQVCTVSLAAPVDQRTGLLVQLPDSPFLVSELDLRALIGEVVETSVRIDNDVNWAALAEHRLGAGVTVDGFCYCYLGAGLGAGLVLGGEVVHGARGLAGELGHLQTVGSGGRSRRLVECFADWGLTQPGTAAVDLGRLAAVLTGTTAPDRRRADAVIGAVAVAISNLTAMLNPPMIIIGGPWSTIGNAADRIAERLHATAVVDTEVVSAVLGDDAALAGARSEAVRVIRSLVMPMP